MRLIDADAFAEKFTGQYEFMKRVIGEQLTVDAVEVVRCKDCKYCDYDDAEHTAIVCLRDHRGWNKPEDFCSYGERKE